MAIASKSAETPAGKESGAEAIRASGEAHRPRLTGGTCPMRVAVEGWILRYGPDQRVVATDGSEETEKEIKAAAFSIAHNLMVHGFEEKARAFIETYGLSADEVARSSSLPPEPKK